MRSHPPAPDGDSDDPPFAGGHIHILGGGLKPHDIRSNEHSPGDFALEQDAATGDITIRYSSPAGLPFAFAWTSTVRLNGTVTTASFQFMDNPPLLAH